VTVVGTRPQFIKAALVSRALKGRAEEVFVHTGQHYDQRLSDVFLEEFGLSPSINCHVGSGSHGEQTGEMLKRLEVIILDEKPDKALVYGDTNSTLAGALAAAKLGIPVAHVEAGVRSFDRAMPEEINRIVTDHISSQLLAPTGAAVTNLIGEGLSSGITRTGDVMVQLVREIGPKASQEIPRKHGLDPGKYVYCTLHRPFNVDDATSLRAIIRALSANGLPVVLPMHPRTRKRMEAFGITPGPGVRCIDPVGYLENLSLVKYAARVVTDSGGLQKESYELAVPCITIRPSTEWPETIETGWNILMSPFDKDLEAKIRNFSPARKPRPDLYPETDPAGRIVKALLSSS